MSENEPCSVTQLLARLKYAVECDVGEAMVVGEIGSCKVAGSGHVYFTLKDATAQLACVFYRYQAASCRVHLIEGLRVELVGRATVWEGRGTLQFVVERVREAGVGSLQQQFEEMKRRLEAEGLFSASRKRTLPRYPESIGIITSVTGAVIQDMRHRLEQRAPWVQVYLLPVQVQGKGAEHGLARAVQMWSESERFGLPPVDFVILARGGGSLEDLWCFNEEVLARAIAASHVPVVSAVGHETDFTIADFVADLRAPTPTAAIELTTPDSAALLETLDSKALTLRKQMTRALETARLRLLVLERGKLRHPQELLEPFMQRLDVLHEEMGNCCNARLQAAAHQLALHSARLQVGRLRSALEHANERLQTALRALRVGTRARTDQWKACLRVHEERLAAASPLHVLKRGFALVRTEDGALLRRAKDAPAGTKLHISLSEGELTARTEVQSEHATHARRAK